MADFDQRLLRVGVFYDGNFFSHVSNYYRYAHAQRKRISISGLHEFIRYHVSKVESVDVQYCHIVDAHYFRGRFWAKEADHKQKLFSERVFDDVLMAEGVVTHYLPMQQGSEKGIDVWLALEAFELAIYKRFNVLVLIGGDSDFIPLVRKVNTLGTRIMVLAWDVKYIDDSNVERETVTSVHLLNEVTYPVIMHQIIDDKTRKNDPLIKNLFVEQRKESIVPTPLVAPTSGGPSPAPESPKIVPGTLAPLSEPLQPSVERCEGEILNLQQYYGFIKCAKFPSNVFFHANALVNKDFEDLQKGQKVKLIVQQGNKGPVAREVEVQE